jgi:hypothetical protein
MILNDCIWKFTKKKKRRDTVENSLGFFLKRSEPAKTNYIPL